MVDSLSPCFHHRASARQVRVSDDRQTSLWQGSSLTVIAAVTSQQVLLNCPCNIGLRFRFQQPVATTFTPCIQRFRLNLCPFCCAFTTGHQPWRDLSPWLVLSRLVEHSRCYCRHLRSRCLLLHVSSSSRHPHSALHL